MGTRVVLADDHAATRIGVRCILEADGFEVCGEAGTAEEAVAVARREEPDLCLVDVHMPGSGVSAAEVISRELPSTAVVMLTVSSADEDLFAALEAGARGYLLKDIDPDRLGPALRGAMSGQAAVPRELMTRVLDDYRRRRRRRLGLCNTAGVRVELTDREYEILDALRDGRSTKDIAADLVVSPVTVRRHISSLMHKLRVSDRATLLALIEEQADA